MRTPKKRPKQNYRIISKAFCVQHNVLSEICAHLSSSIISATMAWHLVMKESRFLFSHEFVVILLSQMEDWLKKEAISFRYRRSETTKEGWLDSLLMNYVFQPELDGFEEMSAYEFSCNFELCLKSSLRKKKEDDDNDGENELEENEQTSSDAMYVVNWDFMTCFFLVRTYV